MAAFVLGMAGFRDNGMIVFLAAENGCFCFVGWVVGWGLPGAGFWGELGCGGEVEAVAAFGEEVDVGEGF